MNKPFINILILNWNQKEILLSCINSIKKSTYTNYKITIIDNGSTDGSIRYIKSYFNDLFFIKIESNIGYSPGYNYAFDNLKSDDSDWFLLLNNDTELNSNTLQTFVDNMLFHKDEYIYGCKIKNINDDNIWYAGGNINYFNSSAYHRGVNSNSINTTFKSGVTDFVSGCCMFINKKLVYKINGFNERYNFYYEDVDLCLRAKKYNVKSFYISETFINHHISYSLGGRFTLMKIYRKLISFIKFLFFNNNILMFIYYLLINIFLFPIYLLTFTITFLRGAYANQ